MMINCCFSLLIQFLITNVSQYSFREVDLKEERTKSEIVEIFTIGCHGKKYWHAKEGTEIAKGE